MVIFELIIIFFTIIHSVRMLALILNIGFLKYVKIIWILITSRIVCYSHNTYDFLVFYSKDKIYRKLSYVDILVEIEDYDIPINPKEEYEHIFYFRNGDLIIGLLYIKAKLKFRKPVQVNDLNSTIKSEIKMINRQKRLSNII